MNSVRDQRWSAAEVSRLITLLNGERHYLEIIFDALPVAVAIVTGDLTIRAANGAFATLFGVEAESAAGTPLMRATGDRHASASLLDALECGGRSVVIGKQAFLCSRIPASEDIVLVEFAGQPEANAATPQCAAAMPNAAQQPGDRFEDRMSAISQLAGGLSHELNNILTIITSYCHLAIEQLESSGIPTEDVLAILKAAGDASTIGSQLVHIGGRHVSHEESVDVNAILRGLEPTARQLCAERVLLEVDRHPDLPPVAGDRKQLEAAIGALLEHAIEAVGDDGKVVVRTRPSPDRRSAELVIEDNRNWPDGAVGMRLFEPYATYPGSKKTAGLKLAAAYSIVRQSGGEMVLGASSQRTTVTVRLPARLAEPRKSAVARPECTVLLVDDKDDVRSAIRQMLQRQGYTVVEAEGPEEALRAVEESSRLDILLSDMDMPEMSGCELARRARRMRPAMKIVLMSGYAGEQVTVAGSDENGFMFLQKPFSPDRLLATLRRIVEPR